MILNPEKLELMHSLFEKQYPAFNAKFNSFVTELKKWNRAYNLVSRKLDDQRMRRMLLRSLTIVPLIDVRSDTSIIDVGAGCGRIGIILALALPTAEFILVDADFKRTEFLQHIKRNLDLDNVEIIHKRIEECHSENRFFDYAVTSAFGDPLSAMKAAWPCLKLEGTLIIPTGKNRAEFFSEKKKPFDSYSANLIDERQLRSEYEGVIITLVKKKEKLA